LPASTDHINATAYLSVKRHFIALFIVKGSLTSASKYLPFNDAVATANTMLAARSPLAERRLIAKRKLNLLYNRLKDVRWGDRAQTAIALADLLLSGYSRPEAALKLNVHLHGIQQHVLRRSRGCRPAD
jgi:hypothetical protein